MEKTLIGKDEYLFLKNDSSKEIEIHCNNYNPISDLTLSQYIFENYYIVVFPDKSLIYKEYLPNNLEAKYRPSLEVYKKKFGSKLLDAYEFLKDIQNTYYKTDTHINFKGAYIIYKKFIENINNIYNLDLIQKEIHIESKNCNLHDLSDGIGDLLWEGNLGNLGNQIVNNKEDIYYFSNDINKFYCHYIIKSDNNIKFLNYDLIDNTIYLENQIVDWNIISNYIVYNKNTDKKYKVLIFYDSFLISTMPLYLELFYEIYFVKNIYNNDIINKINPDYVFEFRVERFLI